MSGPTASLTYAWDMPTPIATRYLRCLSINPVVYEWATVTVPTQLSDLSGTLAIGAGGTGHVTAAAGFDALAPLTTRGDLVYRNATTGARLAIGTAAKYMRSDGTDPSWQTVAYADISGTPTVPTEDQMILASQVFG